MIFFSARSKSFGLSDAPATRAASAKRWICSESFAGRFFCGLRTMLKPTCRSKAANFSDLIYCISEGGVGLQKFAGFHAVLPQCRPNLSGKTWKRCIKHQQLVSVFTSDDGFCHGRL